MRAITGASRWAEPCTKACRMPASVWLTLSCSDASDTGRLSICRAAACSDGRSPSDTSVINSTTVENISSRDYWRWRSASNTASIQSGESACSKAVRAITLAGACCSNRARTTGHADPDFVDASVIPQSWKNRITLKGVAVIGHGERQEVVLQIRITDARPAAHEAAGFEMVRGTRPVMAQQPAQADPYPGCPAHRRIERDRFATRHLEIEFQMILQVLAHTWQFLHHLDAEGAQFLGRPDPG